jgi:hypothetical protein
MRIGLIVSLLGALAVTPSLAGTLFDEEKPDPRCALYGNDFAWSQGRGACVRIKREVKPATTFETKTRPARPMMHAHVQWGPRVGPVELSAPAPWN